MDFANSDPLRARLHDVEAEIRDLVVVMCERPPAEDLDTGELIRFEEDLSIMTSAAKEAISLRRRLKVESEGARDAHDVESTETDDSRGASGQESPG
jgi:hypothetical protein